ncbi:hypothetical protein ACJ2A9_06255 [Anaerobacillus sp. MEB173]|uniref:hypothetical protein n=1 Tax=Anaerobacillus sp. MEB173 TaxID=3383345 RepID=UPI003F8F519A
MMYPINGYNDIQTVISNERKIGGVIEAEQIQLRSGEVYDCPVFTSVDVVGANIYSIGFISKDGVRMIVHVNDISMIKSATHKKIHELNNAGYKEYKVKEKLKYLKRLCKADQGACTCPFVEEAMLIIEDIGTDVLKVEKDLDLKFLSKGNKVVKIA